MDIDRRKGANMVPMFLLTRLVVVLMLTGPIAGIDLAPSSPVAASAAGEPMRGRAFLWEDERRTALDGLPAGYDWGYQHHQPLPAAPPSTTREWPSGIGTNRPVPSTASMP